MELKNLYNIFAKHPEGRWIMKFYNVQLLYDFVKEHPIKRILDLGCGIGVSASVCALALKDKGETDFHIDSVEQFDKCIKIANELIPEELKEHITIHKSDVKVWETKQIPYQYFSIMDVPDGEFDLIVNDGPGGMLENGHFIDLPNGTITKMLLEDKIKAGTYIAWDGRIRMLAILERYFSDNFQLARANQRGDDLNIIERLPNEVKFNDFLLEDMRIQNYFPKYEKDMLHSDK